MSCWHLVSVTVINSSVFSLVKFFIVQMGKCPRLRSLSSSVFLCMVVDENDVKLVSV